MINFFDTHAFTVLIGRDTDTVILDDQEESTEMWSRIVNHQPGEIVIIDSGHFMITERKHMSMGVYHYSLRREK